MWDSIWFRTLAEEDRRLLKQSDPLPKAVDVAIIGAGMIGLSTAYYLSAAGVSNICVIDRDAALAEASGANAGGLWFGQQSPELGPLTPLAKASSHLYGELHDRLGGNFDLRRIGLLELLYSEEDVRQAGARIAVVRRAGFPAEQVDHEQLRHLEPSFGEGPGGAIFYTNEANLHPARLGAAFIRHLKGRNVPFCLGTEVLRAGARLETSGGRLEAATVVIAAGAWTPLVTRTLGWAPPIKPMRGQLLATTCQPPLLRHTIVARRYYYWQLTEGHIAGGGTVEDVGFERGTNPEDVADIRNEMSELLPATRNLPAECAWSGFRPYCEDLKPVVGPVPGHDRIYVAAGHFKKGIMLAPVTGKILADLITTGKTDLPAALLDPARFAPQPG